MSPASLVNSVKRGSCCLGNPGAGHFDDDADSEVEDEDAGDLDKDWFIVIHIVCS